LPGPETVSKEAKFGRFGLLKGQMATLIHSCPTLGIPVLPCICRCLC